MPELMTALYRSKIVCIFDLLDENGQYREEVRSEYRKASQANELLCPECNGVLELCAGVIVAPYFRHKSICDCPISRELKTEAGKRSYHGKKMLYSLGKTAVGGNLILKEEKKGMPYSPILLEVNDKTEAFLYLDGSSRNYEELSLAHEFYESRNIKPYWFLHKKYESNTENKRSNITSNEAEVGKLNDDILYYLDTKEQKIDIKKAYQTPYGERRYYTETFDIKKLSIDPAGEFDGDFLVNYENHVKKEKQSLDRILVISIEDGLDEDYFEFSYCYMDSMEEIWILPKLKMPLAEISFNEQAEERRMEFMKQWNLFLSQMPKEERRDQAAEVMEYMNRHQKVSNWLNS